MQSQNAPQPRPIRVAMIHYRDNALSGGSLRVGETIANHVDPARVLVEMVFAYGEPASVAKQARVPCHFIGAKGPKDLAAWFRARALLKTIRPDVIHFQDGAVWLRLALLGMPAKKVLHIHGLYRKDSRDGVVGMNPYRASTLLRGYLKSTDAQVCINDGARNSLLDLGWISSSRSYVVYNSVDPARFQLDIDPAEARAQLGLPQDCLLLGMVCRLVWEKGCADLLSIIERLPARWHGVICGDGPLRQSLEQQAVTRGIADRIHFIGLKDQVAQVYAALDAYAFLSRYEPFGLVLAEAMASGTPVFGIQGDGEYNEPRYPLVSAEIATLVSFEKSRTYTAALPDWVLDEIARNISAYGAAPANYSQIIGRARAWVETRFAAPLQAEAMTLVYEDVHNNFGSAGIALEELYEISKSRSKPALLPGSSASAGPSIARRFEPGAATS